MRLDKFDNRGFDRGVGCLCEGAWWVVRSLFFAPWLPVPSAWKVVALRLFGARVGRGVVIRSRVNITFPWRVEIGDHVWIGDEVMILSLGPVRIGSHTCISQRAFLCTGSHEHRKETFDLVVKPVTVGDSCWIGAQAFVGPGVTVGSGATVAAGAVAIQNVGAGKIVAGNPAAAVGQR